MVVSFKFSVLVNRCSNDEKTGAIMFAVVDSSITTPFKLWLTAVKNPVKMITKSEYSRKFWNISLSWVRISGKTTAWSVSVEIFYPSEICPILSDRINTALKSFKMIPILSTNSRIENQLFNICVGKSSGAKEVNIIQ